MNQYSSESNGPGPYMGNNHMPPMNYNQSNSMDMVRTCSAIDSVTLVSLFEGKITEAVCKDNYVLTL
jgi:hypothetical protein